MSSTRQTIQNLFETCKFPVLPTTKPSYVFSLFMKATLAVGTIASIFLIFYFASSTQSPSPKNDYVFISDHRRLTTNNISGDVDEKTNSSHILFGIAGSVKTWTKREHYSKLWWKPNITRGFVWFDEKPNTTWAATLPPYRVSGDISSFNYTCWYGSRSAVRLARIVKESFELGLDNVRWFVMGDDDTVYFIDNLVTVLSKYDHNQMYYIGAPSESVEQDLIFSYDVAYGGGGYAISYSLAVELVRILDGCINRYASLYGSDQKIQACMTEIGVPLTIELGFHQLDIRGNPYGFLAAHPVAPLVSLHHLDSLFPNDLAQINSLEKIFSAYKMDPGRTMQHSLCYNLRRNWSVSVSWGYTVQLYPSLLTTKKLETPFLTFKTWQSYSDGPFTFNTRPMGLDSCEKPLVFYLDRVESVGQGDTLTTYKRYVDELASECDKDDYAPALAVQIFKVSASTLNPDIWKLAPRRQCCEVINSTNGVDSEVHVKIRGCNRFENVTPPENIVY